MIDAEHSALEELMTFQNFGLEPVELPVTLTFRAGLDDVFAVRGLLPEGNGYQQKPVWQNGVLTFVYEGSDRRYRSLGVQFTPHGLGPAFLP
jgi:hypothetical protein